MFLDVRRKTIYEYHRVSFMNYEIKSGTILKLTALPTCLQYTSCETCTNHETTFNVSIFSYFCVRLVTLCTTIPVDNFTKILFLFVEQFLSSVNFRMNSLFDCN